MKRLTITLLVLIVLATPLHAAAKRRIGKISAGPPPPTGGTCANYKPIRAGLKATYVTTAPSGNVNFTVTFVSDSPTQTKTTQKVTTAQGTADVETTLDYETVPNASFDLRALEHLEVKGTSTPIPGFNVVTETDIDFVPSYVLGPANGWCVGNQWTSPATNETIVIKTAAGTTTQLQTTLQFSGEVLAIEKVTTPAGTFDCIKLRTATAGANGVEPAIAWNAVDGGYTVKQDSLDSAGNVTSTTTLQSVQ